MVRSMKAPKGFNRKSSLIQGKTPNQRSFEKAVKKQQKIAKRNQKIRGKLERKLAKLSKAIGF